MILRPMTWLAPIRAGTWWEYKTPLGLGVMYATAVAGGVPFARLWPAVLACVAAFIPLASYVCVVNDITDEQDDLRAGKSNRMAGKTAAFKAVWLAACIAGCCVAGVWCFRDKPVAAALYAANWLAFTLYSVPPVRLKARGLAGALADASGGTLLPMLWSTLLADRDAAPTFLVAVGVWATAFGLRGILYHQVGDVDGDRESGVGTLAVRLGSQRVGRLVSCLVFPVELAALGAILWMSCSRYTIPLLAAYVLGQVAMWRFFRARTIVVVPRGWHEFAMLHYYRLWLPLTGILGLAHTDARALVLAVAHLAAFPDTWRRFPRHCFDVAGRIANAVRAARG